MSDDSSCYLFICEINHRMISKKMTPMRTFTNHTVAAEIS